MAKYEIPDYLLKGKDHLGKKKARKILQERMMAKLRKEGYEDPKKGGFFGLLAPLLGSVVGSLFRGKGMNTTDMGYKKYFKKQVMKSLPKKLQAGFLLPLISGLASGISALFGKGMKKSKKGGIPVAGLAVGGMPVAGKKKRVNKRAKLVGQYAKGKGIKLMDAMKKLKGMKVSDIESKLKGKGMKKQGYVDKMDESLGMLESDLKKGKGGKKAKKAKKGKKAVKAGKKKAPAKKGKDLENLLKVMAKIKQ